MFYIINVFIFIYKFIVIVSENQYRLNTTSYLTNFFHLPKNVYMFFKNNTLTTQNWSLSEDQTKIYIGSNLFITPYIVVVA